MPFNVKDAAGNIVSIMTPDEASAATVAAIEQVFQRLASTLSTDVANFPADYPDSAALVTAEAIRVLLAGQLSVGNFPTDFPASGTVTKLEAMRLLMADAAKDSTLAQLRDVTTELRGLNDTILTLVQALGRTLPDPSGRMRANIETGTVTANCNLNASQTLATLTTLNVIGTRGFDASLLPIAAASSAAAQLYDRVITS